jgi:hypothetical protein
MSSMFTNDARLPMMTIETGWLELLCCFKKGSAACTA